jgi:hypothetical protein
MLPVVTAPDGDPLVPPPTSCPHARSCPLFPQFALKSFLSYWRASYCDADFTRCARHRLASQGKPVPLNLLPSGNMMKVGK